METRKKSFKRLFAFLMAAVMVTTLMVSAVMAGGARFDDVPEDHQYYKYIEYLAENKIVSGYKGTNKFGPSDNLTRAQASKMIAGAAGIEVSDDFESKFTDVTAATDMSEHIWALEEAKVVKGFGDTNEFRPRAEIKRGHVAKMVVLAFGLKMGDEDVNFSDLPENDDEVSDAIEILASLGIVSGYKGTTEFRPDNLVTRGEFAKIVYGAMLETETKAVARVEVTTTAVREQDAAVADDEYVEIQYTAYDQFGDEFTLTGSLSKLFKNGVPLVAGSEFVDTFGTGSILVEVDLKAGDKLLVKFVGDKDVLLGEKEFVVVKGEAPEATVIGEIKALNDMEGDDDFGEEITSLVAEDEVKLTVEVWDQYGNLMASQVVRWVVEKGEALITGPGSPEDSVDYDFEAIEAGDLEISAYLTNGQSAKFAVTIGALELEALGYVEEEGLAATLYNNEEYILGVLTPLPDGAILTPSMINFDINAKDEGTTAADINVSAALRADADKSATVGKDDIVVVIKSSKVGNYEIIPFVGESLEKADAKAGKIAVETKLDETVTSIDSISIAAKELKTGKIIEKDIVFRNKHGEVVVVADFDASVVPTGELTAKISTDDDGKNVLKLAGALVKQYSVTIVKDTGFLSLNLKFTAPTLTKIVTGGNVTGVVAGDDAAKTVYSEIKFLDQDQIEMEVQKKDLNLTVTFKGGDVADATTLIKLLSVYKVDKDGKVTTATIANDEDAVVAYQILPAEALAEGTYTVKIADDATGKVTASFTVKVGAKRALKSIDLEPETTVLAFDGKTELKIIPKDQYGDFIAVGVAKLAKSLDPAGIVTLSEILEDEKEGKLVGYKLTVTAIAKGSSEVTVKSSDDNDILKKVTFKVDAAGNLVNSVEIDKDLKDLYSTAAEATVSLTAVAKDTSGNPIPGTPFIWSVKSVEKTSTGDGTVIVGAGGEVTAAKDFIGSAVIEVMATKVGGSTATDTVTLHFDNKPSAAVLSTLVLLDEEEEEVTGVEVEAVEDFAVDLEFYALDQYGLEFNFNAAPVQILVGDLSVVTAAHSNGKVTITYSPGAEVGDKTTVTINYRGVVFNVPVTIVKSST